MIPTTLKNAKVVFEGKRFDIAAVEVPGRDGKPRRREIIVHPGAVVILPLLGAGGDRVVMIRNERVAVGETLLELPAGTLELDEEPIVCAGRELKEETGYTAGRITQLMQFYSTPGICTEKMVVFLATELTPGEQELDEGEAIEPELVELEQAYAMVRAGELKDAKSIAALLYYKSFGASMRDRIA